jgi:lysyl endopeptidase
MVMHRFTALLQGIARSLLLAAAASLAPAFAQDLPVVMGEVYLGSPKAASTATFFLTTEDELPSRWVVLAPPSDAEMGAVRNSALRAKRHAIGFGREVSAFAVEGSGKSVAFDRVGGSRVAKLRVFSPQAAALRVAVRVTNSSAPYELRVAGSADEGRVLGPVLLGGPIPQDDLYWTPVTEGASQVIEIVSPASQPAPAIEIVRVSHLVSGPASGFAKRVREIGNSLSCEIDVACVANPSQALLNADRAAVQITLTAISGGTFLCTATLLADTDTSSQIPYVFAANHCFDADSAPFNNAVQMQQVASTLNTYFFFDATACHNNTVGPYVQLFGGATYLYNSLSLDVMMVRLNESPPAGAFLSGWDANPVPAGTAVTVLHHPAGDLKKFSTGTVSGAVILDSPQNAPTGYWQVSYDQGLTEAGSSGAGILTLSGGQYLLRGALYAGDLFSCPASPALVDFYSRFDVAYPQLRQWLAPVVAAFDVTDLWWNPAESGWGLNLIQHPNGQIFGVWYTYTTPNRPLWIVMPGGQWVNGSTFTGTLYTVSGPNYTQVFDPANVGFRTVGSATLTFANSNNGSFIWTVNGVTGVKVIQRQPF